MDKKTIDKSGVWSVELALTKHRFDKLLCGAIASVYNPTKTADLGCGMGHYCRVLHFGYGWPIVDGYEGTKDISKLSPYYNNIYTADLSLYLYNEKRYDLVMCLEVGEHIAKEHEQAFIDNVCSFVEKDLLLSWAVPGQGGTGHVNEQSLPYIIDEFAKRGFMLQGKKTKYLRKHSNFSWFRNNILAFERIIDDQGIDKSNR